MGGGDDGRQGPGGGQIVAFDFDGTLTFRDCFMAFLAWRAGPLRFAAGLVRLLPEGLAYAWRRDRGRLKAAAVSVFLKGAGREELEQACAAFADSPLGRRLVRPDAAQCWREWKDRGALMLIVTASPEQVVRPFADRLGADVLIGTRLAFREDRVLGAFEGANCRAGEKVERLRARFGPEVRLAAAYGDTSGDHAMLEIADVKGYRVFHART